MIKLLIPILLATCANCFGQSISCGTNGGQNLPVRAEGLTELVGDFQVVCTGGTPTAAGVAVPTVTIQIFLNAQLTSRCMESTSSVGCIGLHSEALLILDEPTPTTQYGCATNTCTNLGTGTGVGGYGPGASGTAGNAKNIFQGIQTASNSITFLGIPIDPPGNAPGAQRIIRIANVRANANGLGVSPGNTAPTSITESITVTPSTSAPISSLTTQAVASVQLGLSTSVIGNAIFQQSDPQNTVLVADLNSSGVSQFSVRFQELFSTAFKKRNIATSDANPAAVADQNDLALGSYNTESGFYGNTPLSLPFNANTQQRVGLPDSGTRLMAHFTQIPSGLLLFSRVSGTVTGGGPGAVRMVNVNGSGLVAAPNTVTFLQGTPGAGASQSVFLNFNGGFVPVIFGAFTPTTGGLAFVDVTLNQNGSVTLTVNAAATANGTYRGNLLLTSIFGAVIVPVSLTIGGSGPISGGGNATFVAGNSFGIAPIPIVNGEATAVYEVVDADSNSFAIVDIPIYVAYGSTLPGLGTAKVNLSYAPVSTVTVAVAANVPRFADYSSAVNAFTIDFSHCATLGAGSASFGASGGPGSTPVTSGPGCQWTASTVDNWITVLPSGPQLGSINYTVASSNNPLPRSGAIVLHTIGQPLFPDQTLTINQAAFTCIYTVSPTVSAFSPAGGTGSITMSANSPLCPFPVAANDYFVSVLSVNFANGSGTVMYSVEANGDGFRFGSLTIADRVVTIAQQGVHVPSPVSLNSTSGSGATHSFVFAFSDPDGWQDLGVVNILINSFLDGRNACYLAYDRPSNVLYLVGDNGGGLTGLVLNGSGSVNNSQCTVNGAASSASGIGNTLTLTIALSFNQTTFSGEKLTFLAARDVAQNNSGWRTMGVWTVPLLAPVFPSIMSVAPSEGSGATQQFAITYRDVASSANLRTMQLLINNGLDGNLACYLGYDHANNVLYLVNDNNSGLLLPGIVPNSGTGAVQNSQCTLNGAGTTKSETGADLTLTISLTFKSSFAGPKVVYTGVQTISNVNSGWHALGFWNVP